MVWESVTNQDLSSLQTIFSGSTAGILAYLATRLNALEKKLEGINERCITHLVGKDIKV